MGIATAVGAHRPMALSSFVRSEHASRIARELVNFRFKVNF
jgi:hypothetical protein